MNLAPIAQIKSELRRMYPTFKFEMKAQITTHNYSIISYKGTKRLGDITINADVPMNIFWQSVRDWMKPFLRG